MYTWIAIGCFLTAAGLAVWLVLLLIGQYRYRRLCRRRLGL